MSSINELAGFLLSKGHDSYAKQVLKLDDELTEARACITRQNGEIIELLDAARECARPGPALRAILNRADAE